MNETGYNNKSTIFIVVVCLYDFILFPRVISCFYCSSFVLFYCLQILFLRIDVPFLSSRVTLYSFTGDTGFSVSGIFFSTHFCISLPFKLFLTYFL